MKIPRKYNKTLTLIAVFNYLSAVETLGNIIVDLALLLLIAEGHDIHLGLDRQHSYVRHATTSEDLDSPTLSLVIKLDVLNSLGYPLFSKWINRELRNGIAHLDFEIDESGRFFIINKDGKKREFDIMMEVATNIVYGYVITKFFRVEIAKVTKLQLTAKKT